MTTVKATATTTNLHMVLSKFISKVESWSSPIFAAMFEIQCPSWVLFSNFWPNLTKNPTLLWKMPLHFPATPMQWNCSLKELQSRCRSIERLTLDAVFDLNFEIVQNLESQKLDIVVFWHLSDLRDAWIGQNGWISRKKPHLQSGIFLC